MPYVLVMSAKIDIFGIDAAGNYPDLELALEAIEARPCYHARDPQLPLTAYAHMTILQVYTEMDLKRATDVVNAKIIRADRTETTLAELLQAEGHTFTIESYRGGGGLDTAMWAPGAPVEVRILRRKTIPKDLERAYPPEKLQAWIGLNDEELGRKLVEHFFKRA